MDVGRHSVIIVRDDDERVRAFRNVCRHRGSRILDEERGSVGNLVCPYHHWTYSVDGCLLHAENQPPTLDRGRFGLKPVHVRSVGGLVFICLADEPPADFDDVAARLEPYLAPYGLRQAKVAHQVDVIEDGNWKLVMENNRECYHCDGHPELVSAYFPLHGYTADDVPPRLRRVWERYDKARRRPAGRLRPAGLPAGRGARARHAAHRVHGLPRPARRRREVVQRERRGRVRQAHGIHRDRSLRRPAPARAAQRVVPHAGRSRRGVLRATPRAGQDLPAVDLAGPPGRRRGRGLRPGDAHEGVERHQRPGQRFRRPHPAGRRGPRLRAGTVLEGRGGRRRLRQLVRLPGERSPRREGANQ